MAKSKTKNELTDLLDSIRKSLKNKTTLTDEDIIKINDVVEIKKIKNRCFKRSSRCKWNRC